MVTYDEGGGWETTLSFGVALIQQWCQLTLPMKVLSLSEAISTGWDSDNPLYRMLCKPKMNSSVNITTAILHSTYNILQTVLFHIRCQYYYFTI